MEINKFLKKQIILEVIALIFFVGVIIYSIISINHSEESKIVSHDGMVIVIDDSNFSGLKVLSDGQGFNSKGLTYTVTNNNKDKKAYQIVLAPNVHDNEVIKQIKFSIDDMGIRKLTELPRSHGGYVIHTYELAAGYTKVHSIKLWYDDQSTRKDEVSFDYRLELID